MKMREIVSQLRRLERIKLTLAKGEIAPSMLSLFLAVSIAMAGLPSMATGQNISGRDVVREERGTYLVFRNADIRDALTLIAEEYDLNIVMSEDVTGRVNLRLKGASLHNTLDAILISRGLDYEIRDNIIRVAGAEVIESEREKRLTRRELEPLVSEVVVLQYLDANDLKPTIEKMLTSRGTVSVLERRTYKGFQFGTQQSQQAVSQSTTRGVVMPSTSGLIRARAEGAETKPRSNTLLIVDVRSQVERIKGVIEEIDIPPRQVLIDAKVLEVNTESLEDLGLDFNNETTFSASGGTWNPLTTDLNSGDSSTDINSNIFTNIFPTSSDSGIHAVFSHLNGEDFTIILHALLQDRRNKVLSAPKILTIENQEAAILVGEQFPIFEANVTDQGTTTETLSFFQPIGISLQVIAQITPQKDVIMIIHPTVSSLGETVTGTTGLTQPRINVREADTRVLIRSGETLVIGGLLADTVDERYWKLPILGHLPLLGRFFTRRQVSTSQRNLLIFITPTVVEGNNVDLNEVERMTFEGIQNPRAYGLLEERRRAVQQIFNIARTYYENERYDMARAQFKEVLGLDPDHEGARHYLEKMDALPKGKLG